MHNRGQNSNPTLTNCIFSGNSADGGGGMQNEKNSSPTLTNCRFNGNSAVEWEGGGMANFDSSPTLTNCTFSGNSAGEAGGGMHNGGKNSSSPTLTNCILWGNTPDEVKGGTPTITYSDVQGGTGQPWFGAGCIDTNPLFVDAGDLRLSPGSPCIDTGDNSVVQVGTDLDGNPRIFNNIVDMGAYESQIPANQPPVAHAGGDYFGVTDGVLVDVDPDTLNLSSNGRWVTVYLIEGADGTAEMELDGSGSYDDDGDDLTYRWTISDAEGTIVKEVEETAAQVTTVRLPVGEYVAELIVNDGTVDSAPDYALITVELLDVSSLLASELYLNGVQGYRSDFQDPELMVKFDRVAVADTVDVGIDVPMVISGSAFGVDYITAIDNGNGGKKK